MHSLLDPKDPKAPVFDLVIPSLPGFCWSQGPPRDWTLQDTGRIFDVLMKRLGYTSYAAQAGDWGHWVVRELGSGRYNACKAVHTNMCPGAPPKDYKMNAKEQAAMDRAKWWMGEHLNEGHMGYAIEMRTRPQTIGVAFNDNPVGIMMFIGEKYDELADPTIGTATLDREEYVKDVCTTLSLYFFTPPSIMTSMLCYTFNVRHEVYTEFNAKEENLIRVPLGVSTFPYDAFPVPKAGAETTTTNLKFFRGECGEFRTRRSKLMVLQNVNTVGISPAWRCTRRWLSTCASSLASSTRLSRSNRILLMPIQVVHLIGTPTICKWSFRCLRRAESKSLRTRPQQRRKQSN